jgi:hypothetical protein
MTNKEIINRNIGLTFDFVKHLIDDTSLIEKLPDNFVLEFVEKDFGNIIKENGKSNKKKKGTIVKVKNSFEFTKV